MNPFETNTMPVDRMPQLLYREDIVKKIKDNVERRKQTVIQGVEGVGKTSLLNCVFNRDYRKQKALEGTLVSPVTEFPSDLKSDDIYTHFAEMIINSVRILSQCGKSEEMETILKECREIRDEKNAPETYFEKIVSLIYNNYEYHIVMVIDNFERFTSSKEVTMKHHETLRKLLKWSQYIVATNYDLNEDSLPRGVSGSFLLMNFAGNAIRVGGWSEEQTAEYLNKQIGNTGISFSKDLTSAIHSVTGGIPLLLNLAANYAYEYIESNGTEEGLKFGKLYNEELVQALLSRWCKMLNQMQITAIRDLLSGSYDNEIDKAKLRCLYLRGVLDYLIIKDGFGNIIISDNEYQFCCRFLGKFCRESGKLEEAAAKNPLRALNQEQSDNAAPDLSISELFELLKKKVDEENVTKEQLLFIAKTICKNIPNVLLPIDLDEKPTDEILGKYSLSYDYLNYFDQSVQDFLCFGIQMDRCFENVSIVGFDYSTIYISFCKAIEAHLNLTLVPVMKKICPDATDKNDKPIASLPKWRNLTLGEIFTILNKRQIGCLGSVIDEIITYCQRRKMKKYSSDWGNSVLKKLDNIRDYRNKCPHTSMLKDKEGKELLKNMFTDSKSNPRETFMVMCLDMYNDVFNS